MSFNLRNKDLTDVDFEELEELFAKLTPEEIELLNNEVDPDVSRLFYVIHECLIRQKR
jgi:hypothetical protein